MPVPSTPPNDVGNIIKPMHSKGGAHSVNMRKATNWLIWKSYIITKPGRQSFRLYSSISDCHLGNWLLAIPQIILPHNMYWAARGGRTGIIIGIAWWLLRGGEPHFFKILTLPEANSH